MEAARQLTADELLGEDATGTRRLLRLYHLPWQATEEERAAHLKRATWEAGVLRSLPRIPEDVRLPLVDQPVSTDEGVVVPNAVQEYEAAASQIIL